jgi:hypothetical protein
VLRELNRYVPGAIDGWWRLCAAGCVPTVRADRPDGGWAGATGVVGGVAGVMQLWVCDECAVIVSQSPNSPGSAIQLSMSGVRCPHLATATPGAARRAGVAGRAAAAGSRGGGTDRSGLGKQPEGRSRAVPSGRAVRDRRRLLGQLGDCADRAGLSRHTPVRRDRLRDA